MDATERERLLELQVQRNEELKRQVGDELEGLGAIQKRLLAITIDTDAPDPDPYRDLSDRVLPSTQETV